jgi:hypothetical protein
VLLVLAIDLLPTSSSFTRRSLCLLRLCLTYSRRYILSFPLLMQNSCSDLLQTSIILNHHVQLHQELLYLCFMHRSRVSLLRHLDRRQDGISMPEKSPRTLHCYARLLSAMPPIAGLYSWKRSIPLGLSGRCSLTVVIPYSTCSSGVLMELIQSFSARCHWRGTLGCVCVFLYSHVFLDLALQRTNLVNWAAEERRITRTAWIG